MELKLIPYPDKDVARSRVKAIGEILMNDGDYTEELLEVLLDYWGELEEYSHIDEHIYMNLKMCHEYVIAAKAMGMYTEIE